MRRWWNSAAVTRHVHVTGTFTNTNLYQWLCEHTLLRDSNILLAVVREHCSLYPDFICHFMVALIIYFFYARLPTARRKFGDVACGAPPNIRQGRDNAPLFSKSETRIYLVPMRDRSREGSTLGALSPIRLLFWSFFGYIFAFSIAFRL
jgi:hypothetical protein